MYKLDRHVCFTETHWMAFTEEVHEAENNKRP